MINLASASLFLPVSHFGLSSVRGTLVRWIGEKPFSLLYLSVTLLALSWLILAYWLAPRHVLFVLPPLATLGLLPVVLLGLFLIVAGITTPNPTIVGSEALFDNLDVVRGVLRISRNAFLWGVGLVACAHILAIGTVASALMFGSLAVLGLLGAVVLDAKKSRRHGSKWRQFERQTSSLPFYAILEGHQHLSLDEIKTWRMLLTLIIFVGLIFAETRLPTVSVWPSLATGALISPYHDGRKYA